MGAVAWAFRDVICAVSEAVRVVCVETVGNGEAEDGG